MIGTGIAIGSGVTLSLVSTYVIAKDDYINYWLSNIDTEFNDLVELSQNTEYHKDIIIIYEAFRLWKNKLINRTLPILYGKLSCMAGTGSIIGGYLLGSVLTMSTGLVGLTAGGCYILFKHLTYKDLTEPELFQKMLAEMELYYKDLNQELYYPPVSLVSDFDSYLPSAPSNDIN